MLSPKVASSTDAGQVESGRSLFEKLHCAACHNPPGPAEADPQKISLASVREKFAAGGSLMVFMQKPNAHYAWIRMPDFKLNNDEAAQLAAYLLSAAAKPNEVTTPSDALPSPQSTLAV